MTRARRHQRFSAALAFGLLALAVELLGRSMVNRIDIGRHLPSPGYAGSGYYPILLVAVKLGMALILARLLWRFLRARSAERAARRLLTHTGRRPQLRLALSLRLWLLCFAVTATFFLFQNDSARLGAGRWPLLGPWLHSSALPVFAVLSVLMALAWRAVRSWLAEYESYAQETFARAQRLVAAEPRPAYDRAGRLLAPRSIFGLAFECRGPPLTA